MSSANFNKLLLVRRSEWHSDMNELNYSIETDRVNADHLPRYPTLFDLSVVVDMSVQEDGSVPQNISETIGASAVWDTMLKDDISEEEMTRALITSLGDEHIFRFVLENLKDKKTEAEFITEGLQFYGQIFSSGLNTGIELGYIPIELKQSSIDFTLLSTPIFLYDGIDFGAYDVLGDYANATNRIRLLKSFEYNPEQYLSVLTHERVHVLAGGTFSGVSNDVFSYRTRTGFSQEIHLEQEDSMLTHTALNEAITEHVTKSIINGEWDVIDPLKRNDFFDVYVYVTERHLLGDLIDKSAKIIDLKTIISAYFEDSEPNSGFKLRKAMVQQFIKAYEYGTLRNFEKLVDLKNRNPLSLDSEFRDMIHAPEIDKNGKVVKKGCIKLTKPKGIQGW